MWEDCSLYHCRSHGIEAVVSFPWKASPLEQTLPSPLWQGWHWHTRVDTSLSGEGSPQTKAFWISIETASYFTFVSCPFLSQPWVRKLSRNSYWCNKHFHSVLFLPQFFNDTTLKKQMLNSAPQNALWEGQLTAKISLCMSPVFSPFGIWAKSHWGSVSVYPLRFSDLIFCLFLHKMALSPVRVFLSRPMGKIRLFSSSYQTGTR